MGNERFFGLIKKTFLLGGVSWQALVPLGALAGGGAGLVADRVGRKPAVLMSAVPNLIGWFLLCLAHYLTDPSTFKSLILIGRLFTGVATGWSLVCTSVRCIPFNCKQCYVLTLGILVGKSFESSRKPEKRKYGRIYYWFSDHSNIGEVKFFVG